MSLQYSIERRFHRASTGIAMQRLFRPISSIAGRILADATNLLKLPTNRGRETIRPIHAASPDFAKEKSYGRKSGSAALGGSQCSEA
jgi:hypothetical protein